MDYYEVQIMTMSEKMPWMTLKDFNPQTGIINFDSSERLTFEQAEARYDVLSKRHRFKTFRINRSSI